MLHNEKLRYDILGHIRPAFAIVCHPIFQYGVAIAAPGHKVSPPMAGRKGDRPHSEVDAHDAASPAAILGDVGDQVQNVSRGNVST